MSFISYKIYLYLHLAYSIALFFLPIVLGQGLATKSLSLFSLLVFICNLLASQLFLKVDGLTKILRPRILLLTNFLFGSLVTFIPYLFNFTDQRNLMFVTYVVSFLSLLTLFFLQTPQEEQNS